MIPQATELWYYIGFAVALAFFVLAIFYKFLQWWRSPPAQEVRLPAERTDANMRYGKTEFYKDELHEFRWRTRGANRADKTADSGEGYKRTQGARRGACAAARALTGGVCKRFPFYPEDSGTNRCRECPVMATPVTK